MKYGITLFVLLLAWIWPNSGLGGLIGEPAPPLLVKEWIKGNPVEINSGTNIFVVGIWNTTSAACRASITNFNHLQKRFETNGVVIVGISDEPLEKLKTFVMQAEGTNIQYHVAADDRRKTSIGFMKPVRQRGIPYAFVVGTNGLLLWHGSPQRGLEAVLEQICAGQFDLDRVSKNEIAHRQMAQYLYLARRGDARAEPAGLALLANRTNDVSLLCDLAFQIVTAPKIPRRDFALAGVALDHAEKLETTNTARVMIARSVLLFETGRRDEGLSQGTQALASAYSPMDKTNIQSYLRVMQARQAAIKSRQIDTNQSGVIPTSSHVPTAVTNQNQGSSGKP